MKSPSPANPIVATGIMVAVAFLSWPPSAIPQGSLTPPGAPAPAMKTLQQIEPRIDLQNASFLAVTTNDPNYHYIITQPGSYYLSDNLGVTKANGIWINAAGVTLDLNGFEISRASGSGGYGIEIRSISYRASVRNGSIKGFAYGVVSTGVAGGYADACAFRDLAVGNCTNYGIHAGIGAVLERCRAHNNSGTAGIFAGSGSSLANCSATDNSAAYGIFVSDTSSLVNCTAAYNRSTAALSAGIGVQQSCTISHCNASVNSSTVSSPSPTTGMGFSIGHHSTIQGCTAAYNMGDGINIDQQTVVRDNACGNNGASGNGGGIHATGNHNRIEGNNVTSNTRGIKVDSTGNLIIRNSAAGNNVNWDVAAQNFILVINAAAAGIVSGDSGGTALGAPDPWANLTY